MRISCVTKNLEGPSSSIMRLFHHFFWIGFKSICISLVWPQSITLYYYKLLQNYFPFFQNLNLNNQTTLRRWQCNKTILLDRRWQVLTSKCFNAQESGFFSQENYQLANSHLLANLCCLAKVCLLVVLVLVEK